MNKIRSAVEDENHLLRKAVGVWQWVTIALALTFAAHMAWSHWL